MEIAEAIEAKKALISVDINKTNDPILGASFTTDLTPRRSFFDMLFGNSPSFRVTYTININMSVSDPTFLDVNGNKFYPSLERVIGHELGHLYIALSNNFVGGSYDAAVGIENEIAVQLDSSAPIRHPTLGHSRF